MKARNVRILAGAGILAMTLLVLGGAFARPAGAQEPATTATPTTVVLVEVGCDGGTVANLNVEGVPMRVVVQPGQFFVFSSDPGNFVWKGQPFTSPLGVLGVIYNDTEETQEFSGLTGWNKNGWRQNLHGCLFWGTFSQAVALGMDWNSRELKPVFWVVPALASAVAQPVPAQCPEWGSRLSDLGTDTVTVEVGCSVWMSGDPLVVEVVGGETRTLGERSTTVIPGPATFKVSEVDPKNVHVNMGKAGRPLENERDGAPIAIRWDSTTMAFVDR